MKRQQFISRFLTGILVFSAFSVSADTNESLPVPLKEAAAAYKSKGSGGFMSMLVKGSRLQYTDPAALTQASELFNAIEASYGDYRGIEIIESISISHSIRIVYFVINYERGPLYGVADIYMTKSGEIVTNSNVNTSLEEIIPASLIAKLRK